MRINLNYVNAYLVNALISADAIVDVKANGLDIIHIELGSSEIVAIHLIERDIDLDYIKDTLAENAAKNYSTLFILWSAMLLPEHGDLYLPYDWMSALLALYGDKIYAYEVYGKQIYIFPVYFDNQAVGIERDIRYGEKVNMGKLASDNIHMQSQYLRGTFRVADFEGGAPKTRQEAHQTQDDSYRYSRMRSDRNPISVYYEVLGVSLTDDLDTIKKVYRQLAMLYHPDLNKSPEANERMQQINTAYAQIMEFLETRN
jgi:hypothetical protein